MEKGGMSTVPRYLRECADVYEERNKLYGDNYLRFGAVMQCLFPDGLTVKTRDDWNRLGVFVQIIGKDMRYAEQFLNGGHEDSLVDGSVYKQMLRELDQLASPEEEQQEKKWYSNFYFTEIHPHQKHEPLLPGNFKNDAIRNQYSDKTFDSVVNCGLKICRHCGAAESQLDDTDFCLDHLKRINK